MAFAFPFLQGQALPMERKISTAGLFSSIYRECFHSSPIYCTVVFFAPTLRK